MGRKGWRGDKPYKSWTWTPQRGTKTCILDSLTRKHGVDTVVLSETSGVVVVEMREV